METILLIILELSIGGSLFIFETKILNKLETITLVKRNQYQNFKIIDKSPIINQITKQKNLNISNNQNLKQIISKFTNVLKQKLSKEEMQKIKFNLENLQYKEGNGFVLLLKNTLAQYIMKEHCINTFKYGLLEPELYEHTIFHELLHAVTSSNFKNKSYVGFAQTDHKNRKQIGRILNEGYTELLTKRLFGDNLMSGYQYEVAIAELIEFIIGREKMQKLYFNIDLDGLINELSKYEDINRVKQFILDLDTIHELYGKTKYYNTRKTLLELYNKNSIFLYKLFYNKIDKITNTNNLEKYETESNKFLKIFLETTKHTTFAIEKEIQQIKKREKEEKKNKTKKKLIKTKQNRNGFINILTITTLITIISILSISISYLILHAR